jgi:hypothetical protein
LGGISVNSSGVDSVTCNFLNTGNSGISTLGPRVAEQGVARVAFGQTIDGTLPYQPQLFGGGGYVAVKFYLSPEATTPNYGWIQGGGCDILTTSVPLIAFGYNTVPGQPITAGAPAMMPPGVSCTATPSSLWPPNGKSVSVIVSGSIIPGTSGIGAVSYAVTDEYQQFQPSGPIVSGPGGGSYSFEVPLIAARNGDDLNGRTYTITVTAKDMLGNPGSCAVVVTVPHDQGH